MRRWLFGAGFLLVGWAIVAGALLAVSASAATDARALVADARARFGADELIEGEGKAVLEHAATRFAEAESSSGSLILAPARALPVLGRQIRSLNTLAGAGADVLAVVVEASGAVDELRVGAEVPASRVASVTALRETVSAAAVQLRSVSLGPDEALIAPLARARQIIAGELVEALESLDRAELVTSALVSVLEGSRYLVLAANNAEMQAGWGMPLSVGVLEVVDGDLGLTGMQAAEDLVLPAGAVPIIGDFEATWGFMRPSQDFRNLALTASFPEAAPVAAAMWEELGRGAVDGVIALDPLALRAILTATGPVEVEDGIVTAEDVVPFVLHDAYVDQQSSSAGQEVRRERQSDIAVATVASATSAGTDLLELARSLAEAAASRHVMVWSIEPNEQAAWAAAGVDGGFGQDSLLIGAVNRSANKLDWFLDVSASLQAEAVADGIEVTIEIELLNRTPDGEPSYVAGPTAEGPDGLLAAGDWRGFLTVHVPGEAASVRIDGLAPTVDGRSWPTRVGASVVLVPKGQTQRHVVEFTLPAGPRSLTVEPSARVRPVQWEAGGERWSDDIGARTLTLG